MATNEILQFAETDTGTNLLTQAEYLADTQRLIGNQPGVARSKLVNKALRQSSLIAAAVAQFIADNQSNNITDNLTPQTIANYLRAALSELGLMHATETRAGIVELATAAEAQALASAVVALTPARLADAFRGANQSLSGNGYQRLPGGLIVQWGTVSIPTGLNEGVGTANFPIAFPNQALRAYTTLIHGGTTSSWFGFTTWPFFLSATQVTVTLHSGSTTREQVATVAYLAIGY